MRLLLDEHLPIGLSAELYRHVVDTVSGRGWSGIKNGELLRRMSGHYAGVPRLIEALRRIGTAAVIDREAKAKPAGAGWARRRWRTSRELFANHGPVVAGSDLDATVNATEELEKTAKLYLLLAGAETRYLMPAQLGELGAS